MNQCNSCKNKDICKYASSYSIATNNVRALINTEMFTANIVCKRYEKKDVAKQSS